MDKIYWMFQEFLPRFFEKAGGVLVGASFVSTASPQTARLAHSAAPPLPTKAKGAFAGAPLQRPGGVWGGAPMEGD